MNQASPAKPLDGDRPEQLESIDSTDRSMNGAQVVDRVIDILEAFVWLGPSLGVSELSRALGLKKATTHRLLASLRRRDIVAQDPVTRRYHLGMKLWQLGSMATSQVDWVERAKPFLRQLTEQTGETTHLAVLDDYQVLYVDKVESSHSLRMPSQVGRRLPAHCSGVGKALIAWLPQEELDTLVARHGLASFTQATITTPKELAKELAKVRECGYSVDNEEIERGLRCIGAPVRDHNGNVIAAISIAGPSSRLRPEDTEAHARSVMEAARSISSTLGAPATTVAGRFQSASSTER